MCRLVSGDVYRRDEIDAHHYPVFHQMDGVCVYDNAVSGSLLAGSHAPIDGSPARTQTLPTGADARTGYVVGRLKADLEHMVRLRARGPDVVL